MKRSLLLSAALGALLILGGCANQNHPDTTASNTHGLVGPGSVAPVSGGPAGHPGRQPRRFQP